MKCKCGNELGKPLVNPRPVSFLDDRSKLEVKLLYMAGFDQNGRCWFCAFSRA